MISSLSSAFKLRSIRAFQVRRDGDLRFCHVSLGLLQCGSRRMGICGLLADGILNAFRIQPYQLVACGHFRSTLDHPVDRAVTADFAFDLRVVGTLQGPLFDDRDNQLAAGDRVCQFGDGRLRRYAPANQRDGTRNHRERSDCEQTAFPPPIAPRMWCWALLLRPPQLRINLAFWLWAELCKQLGRHDQPPS